MHTVASSPTGHSPLFMGKIVVDWSSLLGSLETEGAIDSLVNWVRTCPQRNAIHVVLGPNRRIPVRRLRNTLQLLGCTVTTRNFHS